MRWLFAIVAALIGGYALWMGLKIGGVLLILPEASHDRALLTIVAVLLGTGLAFMTLAWRLFRKPPAATPPPPAP